MCAIDARPLITFALISYQDEPFVREAVEAAFSQTYQPLEIILSNDCSPDRTFEVMTDMAARYRGPHSVKLNRNEKNLGTGGHINRIMELSRGDIIVIAAADDISLPDRTEQLYAVFKKDRGRIKSVFSNALIVNEAGEGSLRQYIEPLPPDEFLLDNIVRNRDFGLVAGSSHAWTRDLFETFGPLITPLSVEDSPIAFRAALIGEIAFINKILVKHRRHANNTWQYRVTDPVRSLRYETLERDAVWRNWLKDVRVLETLMPGRKQELEGYSRVLSGRIAGLQEDVALFRSTWFNRARMILANMLAGMPLRTVRHRIGVYLAAPVYRRYLALKCRGGQPVLSSMQSPGPASGNRNGPRVE